ncbi:prostaglandin E receptor 1c (subtype EP1) isoform 2-T2 [Tautogolabrus adspersus]
MMLKMRTSSTLMTVFSTSSTPSIFYQNMKVNLSTQSSSWLNSSTVPAVRSSGLGMSCFTMIFGAISNLTALGILVKSRVRFRRQSKAPFLLLTVALLLADLGGHVIPGAFALYLHINQRNKIQAGKPTKEFCQIFGATVLPFFAVGTYTTQSPGTWCFLPIHGSKTAADTNLALIFSCLGLSALTLSLLCNILSCLALLKARIKSHTANTKATAQRTRHSSSASSSSMFCSLDLEMMVQLAVITVVSCVCWSPFLIHILVMQFKQNPTASRDGFILLGLRMASWNQILDPWVYILLRRAVLFRVCCAFYSQRPIVTENSSYAETHRQAFSLQ